MYFVSSSNQNEHNVHIKCDILKLENQIPLFMLNELFVEFQIPEKYKLAYSLPNLLERAFKQLSPFDLVHSSITLSCDVA